MSKYTIELSDGTKIENLDLSGNNFISTKKITEDQFTGKLATVKITDPDGNTEEHTNMDFVQVVKYGSKYYFILRDKTADEIYREELESQLEDANDAVAELSELIATMQTA